MRCEFPIIAFHDAFQPAKRDVDHASNVAQPQPIDGVSIYEFENQLTVAIDVPGLSHEQLGVNLENGRLTVAGQRSNILPEGAKQIYRNLAEGDFERNIRIDDSFDPNSIDAVLDNGVLTITVTRRAELQPRKVTIRPAN